ncbi:IS66 family insertion sequence element accessory protein TnpA [Microbulbifer thermotolerans]|uniref:Transposase n=2 Tax=Microbulbifer thermotolerans TaxID=252514 RepID=A0AB35I1B0_MICTH|nr:hypothetical protein [Microbulbifer thermotolerans]MCX2803400.1 hypothetical protein [Microbulbifer thermotolerans]MCX2833028.1 hypothetical protein [Microbulbifer thermotolerans]MCX2842118.1 hypothetical protein [Microbulbifer thermotolerans]WKT59528.1 hypothetical protein Q2E61_11545 [Microbulbifer thermotolerans]WKT60296.1 hypothetical protein Q2E61_15500 [Microbulbifer thermotolerans]
MPKITKKQKYWLDHYQAAKSSGKSLAAYAREHQLDAKRFHNWVYLLRKRGLIPGSESTKSSGRFVPVKPIGAAVTPAPSPAEIVLPNGICLRVPALSKALLSDLLALEVAS